MKNVLRIVALILVISLVAGCGLSNEDIGEAVKTSMQETFNSNPQFKEWNLTVSSVQVLKQGGNNYKGLATIMYEGTSHDVPIQITVDGNSVMWEAAPGSFMFVAQKELQKLFQ